MTRQFRFSLARLLLATVCVAITALSAKRVFYGRRIETGEALLWILTGCVSLGVAVAVVTQNDSLGVAVAIVVAAAILIFG